MSFFIYLKAVEMIRVLSIVWSSSGGTKLEILQYNNFENAYYFHKTMHYLPNSATYLKTGSS